VTSRPAAAQQLRDLARLRRVRDRIDREYAQPLDVEALARSAHMSAGHLSREFKLAYDESPYAYLMTRRIERGDGAAASWRPQRHRGLLRGRPLVAGHLQHSLHRAGRRAAQRLSALRDARDGGDPVVRRETGDQTDQESRSAGHRAAVRVTAMDITTTTLGVNMTGSSTQGIKIVLHPVSDLATAKAVYAALLGVPPQTDGSYYVGFEAPDQHIGRLG
jgi:hypothetical protein